MVSKPGARSSLDAVGPDADRHRQRLDDSGLIADGLVIGSAQMTAVQRERDRPLGEPLVHGTFQVGRQAGSAQAPEAREHPVAQRNEHGLLCVNHEYIDQPKMHPNGATVVGGVRTVADEVRKEIAAHGVSVVEIRKDARGRWQVVRGEYNRRVTAATPMEITGPARGYSKLRTKYSPGGTRTRGTINNCAHGYTPWGTYLTCEENWAGYFVNRGSVRPRDQQRYGVPFGATANSRYRWDTVAGDEYARFNVTPTGASATDDYRNEAGGHGWILEVDPFDPTSTPKKRTAMGRFAHEGAWIAKVEAGKPLVWYMGCDSRNEYIYKYVSNASWDPVDASRGLAAGDKYLDDGKLYVAKFNADGTGNWVQKFTPQGDLLARWGGPGTAPGQFHNAFGIACDPQGNVFVTSNQTASDEPKVHKYDGFGNLLAEWGTYGSGNGEFNQVMGIAVDLAGHVYVADYWNHRVQVFDRSGRRIGGWADARLVIEAGDRLLVIDSDAVLDASA